MPYIEFTDIQKQRAAAVDLEAFLLSRGGPLLALGPHHSQGPEPLQGHSPAGPAGAPAGRVDCGGTALEGERKLYVQLLPAAITPEKRTDPSAKGGACPFSGPGGRHGEAPRSYHSSFDTWLEIGSPSFLRQNEGSYLRKH